MVAMLQTGLHLSPVVTHRFPIDRFQEGFDVMRSGRSGKVILEWAGG
jgi:threonine 3-dehydrogenase